MSTNKLKFTEPHILSGRPKDETILVALSGGADSSALLHRLCEYRKAAACRLVAAHVNHGIRGAKYSFEADRDEEFCRSLCNSLGVELRVKRIDVPALAKESGRSLETEAREARYAFFAEIMNSESIKLLATAHNADDNLETQIFNLCRGCAIEGLIGIPETREMSDVEGGIVIRPLLRAEKRDIVAYCEENRIGYVTDSTNLEDDCTRNAIRHRVIPALEDIFPAVKKSSSKLSISAAEDSDFISSEAKRFIDSHPTLETSELRALHPSLMKRVLISAYKAQSDATLEAVHLDALVSLISNKKNGAAVSLPDKKRATVTDGVLRFTNESEKAVKEIAPYSQKLSFGLNLIDNTDFAVLVTPPGDTADSPPEGYSHYANARLCIDGSAEIYASNRLPGAYVTDGGVNKKVKKLMCDKKVPLYDRDTLPLILLGESIIYVPLCAISDSARPTRNQNSISIHIFKKTSEE